MIIVHPGYGILRSARLKLNPGNGSAALYVPDPIIKTDPGQVPAGFSPDCIGRVGSRLCAYFWMLELIFYLGTLSLHDDHFRSQCRRGTPEMILEGRKPR